MYPDTRAAHMAKSHRLSEVQPPPTLEAAEKGIALLDRGHDVGVTRVDQGPWAIPSEPAVPVRKLLGVARVETSPQCRRALSPGIGQELLQHAVERAIACRNLDDFAHSARLYMVEVPAEQPLGIAHGTRPQSSEVRLAGRLLEQPGERASVVHRLQRAAAQDLGRMGQHRG